MTYRKIDDSEVDPDSPITTSLMFSLRENPSELFLFRRNQEFTSPGTHTFNVPSDAKVVRVIAVGAGGGGDSSNSGGGGGGGGAFSIFYMIVTDPGNEALTIEVGQGGNEGQDGTNTSVTGTSGVQTAPGGSGANSTTPGSGGVLTINDGLFIGNGFNGKLGQSSSGPVPGSGGNGGNCPLVGFNAPFVGSAGVGRELQDGTDGGTGSGGGGSGGGSGGKGGDGYVAIFF